MPFRWSYAAFPLAVLLLIVVLSAYFYHLLLGEVAVHFDSTGMPDGWLGRPMTMVLALLPQFLLALIGVALAWGMTKLASRFPPQPGTKTKLKTVVALMGNMVALPQIVFGFAMADIFVYNAYQIHLLPLWAFALIVMVAGGFVIGLLFFRAIRLDWGRRRE